MYFNCSITINKYVHCRPGPLGSSPFRWKICLELIYDIVVKFYMAPSDLYRAQGTVLIDNTKKSDLYNSASGGELPQFSKAWYILGKHSGSNFDMVCHFLYSMCWSNICYFEARFGFSAKVMHLFVTNHMIYSLWVPVYTSKKSMGLSCGNKLMNVNSIHC